MSSAAEADLAGLYISTKEMVPLCHILIDMVWPQPKTPLKTDNTIAVGVTNFTTVAKRIKSMEMSL